jgi:hypothetical protein
VIFMLIAALVSILHTSDRCRVFFFVFDLDMHEKNK